MKDKIIFWLGAEFTHFCVAYGLQKQYDCELYAVVDVTDKPKKFFQEQKLVKFQKIWHFNDHINSNKTPDLQYLAAFEKKYNVDIWKLAINERIFYKFYNFHKFTTEEILSIAEQECRLFEQIMEEVKPDFFITKEASRHHHQLFCNLCNSLGVKTIMMSQAKIGYKCMLTQESHKLPISKKLESIETPDCSFEDIRQYLKSFDTSKQLKSYLEREGKSKSKLLKSALEYLTTDNSHAKTQYYYYGRTKFRVLLHKIIIELKTRYRKSFIDKHLKTNIDTRSPYVYFPMAVDMERNLLITAPYYTNQTEIIRHIVKSLPVDYKLYVKENPNAFSRAWRPISVYKEILDIPNVNLIHPSIPAEQIYKNSSLVISVAGSSAFEAASYGKPSIVFSDQIYNILPSVHRIKEIEELPRVIRSSMQKEVNPSDLAKYLKLLEENTFDFDMLGFSATFKENFYRDGTLFDVEIPEQQLQDFLIEQKSTLDKFVLEHIKKIKWYKANESK